MSIFSLFRPSPATGETPIQIKRNRSSLYSIDRNNTKVYSPEAREIFSQLENKYKITKSYRNEPLKMEFYISGTAKTKVYPKPNLFQRILRYIFQ